MSNGSASLLVIYALCLSRLALLASQALPGCPDHCGSINVPYPFGIGRPECYKDKGYEITCNDTFDPPKAFIETSDTEVLEMSLEGQVHINGPIALNCHMESGKKRTNYTLLDLDQRGPYTLSDSRNRLTGIGCSATAFVTGSIGENYTSGCMSLCSPSMSIINGSCNGIGCCQATVPKNQKHLVVAIESDDDLRTCAYAFLVDPERFKFLEADLLGDKSFGRKVAVALDWTVGNETCEEARKGPNGVACSKNSHCYNSENSVGYRCKCYDGFQGNPYLPNGCLDFDECADPETNPCIAKCENTVGSYCCQCPLGTTGDGRKDGTGCVSILSANSDFPVLQVTLGGGSGLLFFLIGGTWLYWGVRKRKLIKLREKFFAQNGGLLLQQLISSGDNSVEGAKIFTAEELKRATNNFSESLILGSGGYGTVYKGTLPDNKIVAIKTSKVVDQTQIEQFINEVLVLTQINHKNVVKLLGCCLETQVPMLVYEFVTNGTLFHHLHSDSDENSNSFVSISWDNRLRIAAETAGALAYLHSAASIPIIHRDVKSTNILLDENFNAKVSDFGASRLVPIDQTQLVTLVQGTLGYLDPEYFQTGQFSEKSDVYSFGVVLLELLTGKMPISADESEKERNLAMNFISSMRNDCLHHVLEEKVVKEGRREQIQGVAELALRCLKLAGEERPMMKEVAMELEGLRMTKGQEPELQNHLKGEKEAVGHMFLLSFDTLL